MADNVTLPGTGAVVASDDDGSAQHQYVKLEWGPDNTQTKVDTASGKPLPVQLRGSDGTDRSNLLPVSLASGAVASGAVASGAVASGAFASGSIAAGAIAAGATSIADNEDVASADGDRGVKVLFKRTDTPANSSGTDGDYEQPQMSAGRLWVAANIDKLGGTAIDTNSGNKSAGTLRVVLATDQPALTNKLLVTPDANSAVNVAQIGASAVNVGNGGALSGTQRVAVSNDNTLLATWGHGAVGSANPANATLAGFLAKQTALPSASSDAVTLPALTDKYGRQIALISTIRDLVGTQTTTISASTSETTIVTAAASVFNDLIMLVVSNTSASTNTRIDFRDTTAGSILFSLQSNGGQPPIGFALATPIPQTTVNTNWTAQCATSTTDVRVYAVFAKNR